MKTALPVLTLGLFLSVLGGFSVSAQSATPPAASTTAGGSDAIAANIRAKAPFVASGPVYNGIPMEYRLAAIRGPKAAKILDDFIAYGFSDYGSLILTKKEQLPAKLREPGASCSTCNVENTSGRRNLEYYVAWIRNLSDRQRQQLVAVLK
ncbi:hypothetical protein [Gloeobacter kilaueensis]|uniref:Uncharacterized protein n=1 Tax=Gloeobacter kilaueensis (strain ATCC BAA-2537 / CCAP 1431/1 / ULC 316 / JS1) TaxID=1183438 RepID=U5QFL1_GLOK1|nr:hypothetical protein [Gloeobacter kilaueensis]AGY57726.1 hypothetical protein GKIL_1480 [Gloeobacter kilaueensis JS1]